MKKFMKKSVLLLMALMVVFAGAVSSVYADAVVEDWWDTFQEAGYYVYVDAPDGGVNLRMGPGAEYDKLLSSLIPNGTKLYIDGTAKAQNGKLWGETHYSDYYGFVFLGQCSKTAPASGSSNSAQPAGSGTSNTASTPAQNSSVSTSGELTDQQVQQAVDAMLSQMGNNTTAPNSNESGNNPDGQSDLVDPDITDIGGGIIAGIGGSLLIIGLALVIIALLIAVLVITIIILVKKSKKGNGGR